MAGGGGGGEFDLGDMLVDFWVAVDDEFTSLK